MLFIKLFPQVCSALAGPRFDFHYTNIILLKAEGIVSIARARNSVFNVGANGNAHRIRSHNLIFRLGAALNVIFGSGGAVGAVNFMYCFGGA